MKILLKVIGFLLIFMFFSCKSLFISGTRELESLGACSADELTSFFMRQNNSADKEKVKRLALYYIEEGLIEGINSDIAFLQMCLETGFLRFGGLVTAEMNNFCGLGSIDENKKGEVFETEQAGVLAHIQHLKAYATDKPPVKPLADPRYKYVNPKGKAPKIHQLAGTWAADLEYGKKLENLLKRLYRSR